jgi:flagellin-like hook-associated protein FlgL
MKTILDAMTYTAAAATDGSLTRIGNGSYTFSTSAVAGVIATLTFSATADEGLDISKLKFSGVQQAAANSGGHGDVIAAAETIAIRTNEAVTVTKDSGDSDLSLGASTFATFTTAGVNAGKASTQDLIMTKAADSTEMTYKSALKLNEGTVSVQIDANDDRSDDLDVDDPTVAINITAAATNKITDTSFTVNSTDVKSIKMKTGAGDEGEVKLTTSNEDLQDRLTTIATTNTHLTANDDGTFTFKATSNSTEAVIDFGETPVDIQDLKFDEVLQHSTVANSEKIYIETADAVTVTLNDSDLDYLGIDGSDGTANIAGAQSTHVDLVGAEISSVVVSEKLDRLTELGENELTADIANEMMEVIDNALNQLNDIRADFGSTQNQLEVATRSMMVTQTNIKAAESVIRDVDYASESANFNKQNIIAQAGTYAMSQANAMAQNVQRLLQ